MCACSTLGDFGGFWIHAGSSSDKSVMQIGFTHEFASHMMRPFKIDAPHERMRSTFEPSLPTWCACVGSHVGRCSLPTFFPPDGRVPASIHRSQQSLYPSQNWNVRTIITTITLVWASIKDVCLSLLRLHLRWCGLWNNMICHLFSLSF